MASSASKVDMSLDQIIKLQRKESKQTKAGTSGAGTRGRGGNRIRGRGRGFGRATTSLAKRNATSAGTGTSPTRRLGVRANLAARRLLTKNRFGAAGRRGRGTGNVVQQRIAKTIVKRAVMQNRRLAAQQRRSILSNQRGRANANTQRLVADVRRWRNTAKQLQQALQVQQVQPRFRLRRFGNAGGARQQIVSPVSNVKQRLGWRRTTTDASPSFRGGRGGYFRGRRGGQNTAVKGRGTVGQMQSDLIVQNRQVAIRQQNRQQVETFSRGRRQQRIGQARGVQQAFTRSPQVTFQRGGRRGRGGANGNRFLTRNVDVGSSFSQGGTGRQSLHERFGGGVSPVVRIKANVGGFRRGRGKRQIFF